MKVLGIIPARYASSRFPGKPLADICGKPMIEHVWERVSGCSEIDRVVVVTDDERIYNKGQEFGADVLMSDPALESGTARCAFAARQLDEYDIVVNIQGDEPLIDPALLDDMLKRIKTNPGIEILTPVRKISDIQLLSNPNVVKVVKSDSGRALYFSRAAIPYNRDETNSVHHGFQHIGIYMFRRNVLLDVAEMKHELSDIEKLEQLAWLANDIPIHTWETTYKSIGVDTPEDLEAVAKLIANN